MSAHIIVTRRRGTVTTRDTFLLARGEEALARVRAHQHDAQLNDELTVAIETQPGSELLCLRARVIAARPRPGAPLGPTWILEHPAPEPLRPRRKVARA